MRKTRTKHFIIGGAVAGGVALGALISSVSGVAVADDTAPEQTVAGYSLNDSGQTFGTNINAEALGGSPDLILTEATNGKSGYVLREDFYDPMPKTPEEAIAQNQLNAQDRAINVYDVDGKNIIGEFIITGATPDTDFKPPRD